MDDERLKQLIEKRDALGLTDDESDELGRLMADQEGRSYGRDQDRAAESTEEDQREDDARQDKAPSSSEIVESERETALEER